MLIGNMLDELVLYTAKYLPILIKKILYLLVLYITYKPIKNFVLNLIKKILNKKHAEELLANFLLMTIEFLILSFYIFNVFEILGLKTASILTLIGSIGIGVGLALKGGFSDIAAGIQILVSKPFKKGDFIIASGLEGSVQMITFLYTVLNSTDSKKIIVPNSKLSTSVVTTVTANPERRADFLFFVDKSTDIDKVKSVLYDIVSNHPFVLKEKDIFIKFSKETTVALEFIVRVWTLKENFKDLNPDIQEEVKVRFDLENIKIPYQSYVVNIKPLK